MNIITPRCFNQSIRFSFFFSSLLSNIYTYFSSYPIIINGQKCFKSYLEFVNLLLANTCLTLPPAGAWYPPPSCTQGSPPSSPSSLGSRKSSMCSINSINSSNSSGSSKSHSPSHTLHKRTTSQVTRPPAVTSLSTVSWFV